MNEQVNNPLDTLNWDDETPVEFAIASEQAATPPVIVEKEVVKEETKTIEKKDPVVQEQKKEVETKTTEEIDWNEEEKSTTDPKTDEEEKSTGKVDELDATINFLKKSEFISFEMEEGQSFDDLTKDEKQELIEEGFEAAIDLKIEALTKNLSPIAKNILKVASKGEDVDAYIESLIDNDEEIPSDLDMNEEDNQIFVLRNKLKADGNDEEFIESYLENIKTNGKLKSIADKEFNRQMSLKAEKQKEEQARIDGLAKQKREQEFKYKSELSSVLKDTNVVSGVKLSKKEVEELPDYMSRATVEIGGGRKITPYYQDFFNLMKDPKQALLLGKLVSDLKNGKGLSSIQTEVESEVTRKFKTSIQRQQTEKQPEKKFTLKGKSLADVI